ncbi:AraC family transcriptional regulator [Novosphingobium rosa]|uniref:AraC family transcriptional regulator n=1 Tax=Novosphingobium rosa TaxID=76978 RepID=UPI00082D67F2|nr:AraC family transcriptional regulator [Novosphingobium rosa]
MAQGTIRPLGGHQFFASSDVDAVRDTVARIYCDHRLTPCERGRKVDAWQNAVRLKNTTLSAMSYGGAVRVEPGRLENFYLLMLPYAGTAQVEAGGRSVVASEGVGTMLSPTDPVSMEWSPDCAKLMVRIEREAMEQQLATMLGRPLRAPLTFRLAMPKAGHGGNWWQFVQLLAGQVEQFAGPGGHATSLNLLETALIASLLEGQWHNYSESLSSRGCSIAPRHVRMVENYIEAHAAEAISMEDLVRVSGVSGRALYDGFRRFRETSPMAHLRSVRLQRVREELLQAADKTTVSEIAGRWGFFEFGRFAGQYRAMFGEAPSQTLRRR